VNPASEATSTGNSPRIHSRLPCLPVWKRVSRGIQFGRFQGWVFLLTVSPFQVERWSRANYLETATDCARRL